MSIAELEQMLDKAGVERRGFLKKMILSMGYATPIVSVFSMELVNMESAMAEVSNICSNLEMQVAVTASTDPVVKGENVTYTIQVLPCGAKGANNASFSDTLPAGTTFVSATQTQGTDQFALSTPAVGEHGIVSGTSSFISNREITIFEIVVRVEP